MNKLEDKESNWWVYSTFNVVYYSDGLLVYLQLMLLVGESFGEYSDSVCGAVVQIRAKGDKLAIWTKNAADESANVGIG